MSICSHDTCTRHLLVRVILRHSSDSREGINQHECMSWHRHDAFVWEDHRPATGTWKGTAGGNVYSFSGCDDHQTVFDTMVIPFTVAADILSC